MTINIKNFNFRSKFKKFLNEDNRPVITSAFDKFCNLNQDIARNLLWRLNLSTDTACTALSELDLNLEIIPSEMLFAFRNELRFQYQTVYPNFLTVNIPDKSEEAFAVLKAFAILEKKSDSIIANVVFEHCEGKLHLNGSSIQRILFLLRSTIESQYYGGIRSLGFTSEEAEYLKPFHTQIYDLFMAIAREEIFKHSSHVGEEYVVEESEVLTDKAPANAPNEAPDKAANETPVEEPVEVNVQLDSKFVPVTPVTILTNREIFLSFVENNDLNILFHIGQLGFDLNEVMSKKQKINNFLRAAEALSE